MLALLLAFYMPILPATLVDNNDPKNTTDKRVLANISESELENILHLINKDLSISAYEILFLEPKHSVLHISESQTRILRGTKDNKPPDKVILAIGKITANIGVNCNTSCTSGTIFYLDKVAGKWIIIDKSIWFV